MAARTIEEHEADLAAFKARNEEIDTEYAGQRMPDAIRSEWDQNIVDIDDKEDLLDELRARQDWVQTQAGDAASREAGASFSVRSARVQENIWDIASIRSQSRSTEEESRMLVDNSKRAIEGFHFPHESANREDCQEAIDRLLNKFSQSDSQSFARHILTTGSPVYRRAYAKAIGGGMLAAEEQRALQLAGGSGGYAVPTVLDPTIIPTSNQAINPWRAISRVEKIIGANTWNGVSAGAITASRDAELEEVSDDSPTLAQPTATVTKATAFVPFSIEVGQDWGALESEMATLIQDAKDVEEATSFTTGVGTTVYPQGVLVGATGTVAAGTAAFTVAHAYALLEALPPRFRPNGTFVANLAQYNRIRQLDTAGGASIWIQNLQQGVAGAANGQTGASFLGKPAYESSVMSSILTATAQIMIFGDFRYFLILDRIGMTTEVIPHLMGTTSARPIGARGLYAYWRNTSKVLSAAAFKKLVTT